MHKYTIVIGSDKSSALQAFGIRNKHCECLVFRSRLKLTDEPETSSLYSDYSLPVLSSTAGGQHDSYSEPDTMVFYGSGCYGPVASTPRPFDRLAS